MSFQNRQQKGRVITYGRKSSTMAPGKKSPSQVASARISREMKKEVSRSFWDFDSGSSDEEAESTTKKIVSAVPQPVVNGLKRKAAAMVEERIGKKVASPNGASKDTVQNLTEAKPVHNTTPKKAIGPAATSIAPRKSNLKRNQNSTVPPTKASPSRQTPQPPSTPPRPLPTTPISRPSPTKSTPPRSSPIRSISRATKRAFLRVPSSPLSTPPSALKSPSQPPQPSTPTPRRSNGLGTRSRTFSGLSSPRMTPKQEEIWKSLPLSQEVSPSPTRRRLVDKLREEASRTPPRNKTPPITTTIAVSSLSAVSDPFATGIEDEISRILDYQVPTLADLSKPRKELSQSESQGTYLSRQRSFLAEPSVQDGLPGLEALWTHDPDPEPTEEEQQEEQRGVKSWHELKRGGEDKRLLDEMDDLIEECKPTARIGQRRSSVLQIVKKMVGDANWRRKFKDLGLMSVFVKNVQDTYTDPVLLTTCLLAVEMVPRPVPKTVTEIVLEMCLRGLEERRGIVNLVSVRSLGVSKILKAEYVDLREKISKSSDSLEGITAQSLAARVLPDLLVQDIQPLCSFLSNYEGDEWSVLVAVAGSLEKSTQGRIVTGLKKDGITGFSRILQEGISEFESDVMLRKATLSFLRVCINLTNSSTQICEFLNEDLSLSTLLAKTITSNPQHYSDSDHHQKDGIPSRAKEEQERGESRFELLLLSLGLMINFVQESEIVKDLILSSHLATDIKTIFETLITRDEQANHALGYLALLLAHLLLPSKTGKCVIVDEKTRTWVERLLDDFVGIHRVVQSQSQQEVERREVEGMAGEVEKVLLLLRAQN